MPTSGTMVKHKFFATYEAFQGKYNAGQIALSDICFIYDRKQIWTHDCFFECGAAASDLDDLFAEIVELSDHVDDNSIHVTSSDKTTWNDKQNKLTFTSASGTSTLQSINDSSTTYDIPQGTITQITAGAGISTGESPITGVGTISVSTKLVGSTTVNSISNVPVTHRAVLATISATNALSFSSLPEDGFEVHVIIRNSGSSEISITLPSSGNYVCTSETTIYVAAGKYGEVNVITIGSTGYVHGIGSV